VPDDPINLGDCQGRFASQGIQNFRFQGQPLSPTQKLRRELIIDWVEKHKTIPTQADNNWRIVQ
jgi:hypothetical protein